MYNKKKGETKKSGAYINVLNNNVILLFKKKYTGGKK